MHHRVVEVRIIPQKFFALCGEFRVFDATAFDVGSMDEAVCGKGVQGGCVELSESSEVLLVENSENPFFPFCQSDTLHGVKIVFFPIRCKFLGVFSLGEAKRGEKE